MALTRSTLVYKYQILKISNLAKNAQKTLIFQLFPDNSMPALRKLSAISADKPWGKF